MTQNARALTIGCAVVAVLGTGALIDAAMTGEIFAKCLSPYRTKFSEEPYWFTFSVIAHVIMTIGSCIGILEFGRQWRFQRLRERAMRGDVSASKQGVNFGYLHFDRWK